MIADLQRLADQFGLEVAVQDRQASGLDRLAEPARGRARDGLASLRVDRVPEAARQALDAGGEQLGSHRDEPGGQAGSVG